MALPSLLKRDCDEALWLGMGGATFYSFLLIVLVPPASTSSTSQRPDTPKTMSAPTNPDQELMIYD
jgi:hypothetical protein